MSSVVIKIDVSEETSAVSMLVMGRTVVPDVESLSENERAVLRHIVARTLNLPIPGAADILTQQDTLIEGYKVACKSAEDAYSTLHAEYLHECLARDNRIHELEQSLKECMAKTEPAPPPSAETPSVETSAAEAPAIGQ